MTSDASPLQPDPTENRAALIGTLGESSLHAALKSWYMRPGDQAEARVDGYYIDLERGELLIEFQTRHFDSIRLKLANLLERHPLRLVYPVVKEKWIRRQSASGDLMSRRKSPRHGTLVDIFSELMRIPHLLGHPHFTFEALLITCEDVWQDDKRGSWRRKYWSLVDRRLLNVEGSASFSTLSDYTALLPTTLSNPFTNTDLAAAISCRQSMAQHMTYTLSRAGELKKVGKKGRAILYQRR